MVNRKASDIASALIAEWRHGWLTTSLIAFSQDGDSRLDRFHTLKPCTGLGLRSFDLPFVLNRH
jgi:hypothetical protein